jgi:hypothetical protein
VIRVISLRLKLKQHLFHLLRLQNRLNWPLWLFYLPMVPVIGFLGLKHRVPLAWRKINPGIENGGWWGESKSELNTYFIKNTQAPYLEGCLVRLPFSNESLKSQQCSISNSYPLVAKPNRGSRGSHIYFLSSDEDFQRFSKSHQGEWFLQPQATKNHEASILFYRLKPKKKFHIFSITLKSFPLVIGNGQDTIFKLLLMHPIFRFQTLSFLKHTSPRWSERPRKGEKVVISRRGNHSKGALFRDGSFLIQDTLTEKINQWFQDSPGLDFAKVDCFYDDLDGLKNGEIEIIELNGAGSESTHIHDPNMSLWQVYNTLTAQWSLIFQIAFEREKTKKRALSHRP